MELAAIALGSNLPGALGSREANLNTAAERLARTGEVLAQSQWIETAPVGYLQQPAFLNGAALVRTALGAEDLLRALLAIECELGRDRSHGFAKGPRTLDLDLLLFGSLVIRTGSLTVPHAEMHRRAFVLEPLAQIAPDLLHPVLNKTVAELLHSSMLGGAAARPAHSGGV